MRLSTPRLALGCVLLLALAPSARGQIKWTVTYSDTTTGFADTTAAGSTTLGQLRKDSVTAATAYLNTILDGRGTVRLNFDPSVNSSGSSTLASFGARGYTLLGDVMTPQGVFTNGAVHQRALTNEGPFSLSSDGRGEVNFGKTWHYDVTGTTTSLSGSLDLVSVLAHEIGHSLGFSAVSANPAPDTGKGLSVNTMTPRALGVADTYGMFDKFLQKGNVAGTGALFNTDISNSNYASYKGTNVSATDVAPYTGNNFQNTQGTSFTNNTTEALYFGGTFANEVFGGPIPIYSPTAFNDGSSGSHVNVGSGAAYGSGAVGLMNYQIGSDTQRRFQAYEIAMLMDLGWNVYNWNGSTGNWKDGVTTTAGVDTYTLGDSRWRTDKGIVLNAAQNTVYNVNGATDEAPILPVYGQATANIVLNFGGNSYTTTNDVGTVRLSRLNFTNSGAVTLDNGALNFGLNADGTASVLVPKIVQNGAGSVTINSNIQVNNIATQTVLGSTFLGHTGLTIEGTGGGAVTLGGNITGTGGLTKNGTFGLTLSGTGNTYSGGTTINAGTLTVAAGSGLGTGSVTINATGTLGRVGTGSIITGNVTVANNGTLSANLAASGTASQLNLGSNVLDLKTGAKLKLTGLAGFTNASAASYILALLSSGANIQKDGLGVADGFVFGTYVQGTGNGGSNSVQFDMSGFGATLAAGNTFTLRRSGNNLVLDFEFQPVPEPATVLAVGAAGLGAITWLRRKRTAHTQAAESTAAA